MGCPAIMPALVHVTASKYVLSIKAVETNDFVETPPFHKKV
jgi:hypothetical protein